MKINWLIVVILSISLYVNCTSRPSLYDLHYEKDIEQLEEAKNLIALGADVNEVRAREALILHAIKKKSLEFVKFLLSKGADRHIRNRGNLFNAFYGETPLDIAERLGHNEIIKILLEQ